MDNVTHTLVGLLVGETASTLAPPSAGIRGSDKRTALLTLMLIGSNLPDLDFIYTSITGNSLDYLLQHRGHTHTVIGALVAASLLLLLCELWLRHRRQRPSPRDHWHLAIVAVLAPLIHIGLDFTNNYGVHPFWPFWNGWLYGDAVFIVEPLMWSVAAPLVFMLHTRMAACVVGLAVFAGVALSFFSGMVPWPLAAALLTITLWLFAMGRYAPRRTALFTGIAVWLLVSASFLFASQKAATLLERIARTQFADDRIIDRILTPMPVNPLCWDAILVQSNGREIILRHGTLSLAPLLIPAERCAGRSLAGAITAPRRPVRQANTLTMRWQGEVVTATQTLQELQATHCKAAALLQFARAPWALHEQAANRWIIGDLRYDREPELGFAEVSIGSVHERCPRHLPPWIPPRADVLSQH